MQQNFIRDFNGQQLHRRLLKTKKKGHEIRHNDFLSPSHSNEIRSSVHFNCFENDSVEDNTNISESCVKSEIDGIT